jgi:hypothetical protein
MLKKHSICVFVLLILLSGFFGFTSQVMAAELNRKDPVAVANAFLESLQAKDYTRIISLMPEDQRKEYQEIMDRDPLDIEKIFSKDRKKAGKATRVTELRKMTTFSGRPGIAAKVRKKGREVFVVILSKEGDIYSYENSLSVTSRLYKELVFIQKVKK